MIQRVSNIMLFSLAILILTSSFVLAADLADQIQKADQLYYQKTADSLTASMEIYQQLLKEYPDNLEVLWKSARCTVDLGNFAEEPLVVFEQGETYSEKIIQLYPNKPHGYFWKAAAIGGISSQKGLINTLRSLKTMRNLLDQSLEIDPLFYDSHYMLAQLYLAAPGWPISIGDKDKSLTYAKKAVELKAENPAFQWTLYQAYAANGLDQEAQQVLNYLVEMPVTPEFEYVADHFKGLAQEELAK